NSIAERLNAGDSVKFYRGDVLTAVISVAPHAKVAILYNKATFLSYGKDFTERLKRADIKPLNFILPENASLNLENVFDLIGVPDGVRAVVCFDRELVNISAYLATIFKIPVVLRLNAGKTEDVLPAKVPFYLGGAADFFPVNCIYHVVLPDTAPKDGWDMAEQYISLMSKITALSDYRARLAVFGGKPEKVAYDTVKTAVLDAFSSPDFETLFISGLTVEIANLATGGVILYNSADYCFRRIAGFYISGGVRFVLLKKLLKLYLLCAEELNDPFGTPDYNKRAQELSALTKSGDGAYLKGFTYQTEELKRRGNVDGVKASFKKEFTAQNAAFCGIEEKFLSLGGTPTENFAPYLKALKHCGDLPNAFNFMTLIRESGFTEYF
ncbi:MAG: hypothetical protein J6Y43_04795, partial [Clostridia bacterium]|nr:hypothetical protein [Clostridia bacterium]